jgi:cytosine/adenosine deaminase-related metal-dependent hydrolase
VEHLKKTGFLNPELRGTSLAHTVWLSDDERDTLSECNVTCVDNPLSNLRLGSGVMPVIETLKIECISFNWL